MKWVMQTGFVRVASARGDRIYRSVEEMPEDLRAKAEAALDSDNSETILIADPDAYERIVNSGEELPAELQKFRPQKEPEARPPKPIAAGNREWKILLGGGVLAILSLWALWLWAARSGMS